MRSSSRWWTERQVATTSLALNRALDGSAFALAALAVSLGMLYLMFIMFAIATWLYDRRSVPSLVWEINKAGIVTELAKHTATVLILGLLALSIVRRHGRPCRQPRLSIASSALRMAGWAFALVGLITSFLAVQVACYRVLFDGM